MEGEEGGMSNMVGKICYSEVENFLAACDVKGDIAVYYLPDYFSSSFWKNEGDNLEDLVKFQPTISFSAFSYSSIPLIHSLFFFDNYLLSFVFFLIEIN